MHDSIIKFVSRNSDLVQTEEYWQGDTFAARWDAIMDNIVKVTGLSASKNMQPVREGILAISDAIDIDRLKSLAALIRQRYKIDCFQISIDRKNNTAHLLFDFNDRDAAKSVVLNRSQQTVLSAMILRHLHRARPDGSEQLLLYFLKDRFIDNPDLFSGLLDKLKHAKLSKESFNLASDALNYVQKICARE